MIKKSAEKDKLEQFKQIGINRLSLGIQTFNQKHLKMLGRDHSVKEALSALEAAKRIFGSDRVSFDLIFARPGQTLDGIYMKKKSCDTLLTCCF